jgi:hypothetical protein
MADEVVQGLVSACRGSFGFGLIRPHGGLAAQSRRSE